MKLNAATTSADAFRVDSVQPGRTDNSGHDASKESRASSLNTIIGFCQRFLNLDANVLQNWFSQAPAKKQMLDQAFTRASAIILAHREKQQTQATASAEYDFLYHLFLAHEACILGLDKDICELHPGTDRRALIGSIIHPRTHHQKKLLTKEEIAAHFTEANLATAFADFSHYEKLIIEACIRGSSLKAQKLRFDHKTLRDFLTIARQIIDENQALHENKH